MDYIMFCVQNTLYCKKKKKDCKPPNKRVLTTKMEAVMFAELKK